MNQEANPTALLNQSQLIYSAVEVETAISAVVSKINLQFAQTHLIVMSVMTGGLFFCGKLISQLTMPIQLDYVHATRYQQATQGGLITWFKLPTLDLNQQTVLLVDDILDEGVTLAAVHKKCLALGAKQVFIAVLTDKKHNLTKHIQADFIGLEVPNQFVFGCGMDVYGWWRNLPEIRALQNA